MFDPTKPLTGQREIQNPNQPTGTITKEEFDAIDSDRLKRKFGMHVPESNERTNIEQGIINPGESVSNQFPDISSQDREQIVNSFLGKGEAVAPPILEPETIVNQPSTEHSEPQESSEENMFDDIFGGSTPTVAPVATADTPAPIAAAAPNIQEDFTKSVINASLDARLNPNEIMDKLNQLTPQELVRMLSNSTTIQEAVTPPAPQESSTPNLLDKLAKTSILSSGGGEQVPPLSHRADTRGSFDEY